MKNLSLVKLVKSSYIIITNDSEFKIIVADDSGY